MFIDTHCHIYQEYYDNIDELMNYIEGNNISKIINNGCNLITSVEAQDLSNKFENMYFTVGLHPSENLEELDEILDLIKKNISNKKFLGIGEIGLDYHWNKDNKKKQLKVFEEQLSLAEKYRLPVIVHSREATKDVVDILKKYKVKGIIHCFNGSVEIAREYIKMGFKLGINGIITFKNCKLLDVIKEVGVNNIVFETDSPYLTPEPYRGKKNNPKHINVIVEFISEKLNIDREELEKITNNNIANIFDIEL